MRALLVLVLVIAVLSQVSGTADSTGGGTGLSTVIEVSPRLNIYSPGDRIESITVKIFDRNTPLKGVTVSGSLEATKSAPLTFEDLGNGEYRADVNYVIPNGERKVIEIKVKASWYESEVEVSKFLIVDVPEYFKLLPVKPVNGDGVAPGQPLTIDAEVSEVTRGDVITVDSVDLVDLDSGEKNVLEKVGDIYSKEITVPADMDDSLNYFVLARASVNGEIRYNAYSLELMKDKTLSVVFDRSKQDVDRGIIALDVRYVSEDGEIVQEPELNAKVREYPGETEQTLKLRKKGNVFMGTYIKSGDAESAEIELADSFGNSGKADIPGEFFREGIPKAEFPLIYLIIIIVVILVAAAITVFSRRSRVAKTGVEVLETQKADLEKLIAETKKAFYKQQLSEEAANRTITEYEERISLLKKQIEALKQ